MSKILSALSTLRKGFFNLQTLTGLYVALVIVMTVMGLRSSMFITTLVPVFVYDMGGVRFSLLGLLIAASFVIFVSSGSYYAGILPKGTPEYRSANWVRLLAVLGDGLFNLVETVYAVARDNTTKTVFDTFDPSKALSPEVGVMYWVIRFIVLAGIVGIGVIPTLLAFLSSELLGTLQQREEKKAGLVFIDQKDWKLLQQIYSDVGMKWFTIKAMNAKYNLDIAPTITKAIQSGVMTETTQGRIRFTDINTLGLS